MDYFNAFWVGGLICALVQILLDKTKLLPGRVMVLLVCSGAVLSFLGFYQPFIEYAGAGASVPLLGFGNILWKGMKKAIDENGFLGLFTGGFTACAGGGGNGNEQGEFFPYLQNAFHFVQGFSGTGNPRPHSLGTVHGRTSPKADDGLTVMGVV